MLGLKRNLAQKAQKMLERFPVVCVLGARQVGKTTFAKQLCPDWAYYDLQNPAHRDRISADPEFFFEQHPTGLIIDEAQEYPDIFKILRGVIDANRGLKGRFLLTGSSSPALRSSVSETLAGRIAMLSLGTFKTNERYKRPLSPFYTALSKPSLEKTAFEFEYAPFDSAQIQKSWFEGGYPEPVLAEDPSFYADWMENYVQTYVYRDLASLFPKLNKTVFYRFVKMLGKLSSTILNQSDLARALEISAPMVKEYLRIAEETFFWRALPSFESNVIKSMIKMPKGHLRDTGMLHYFVNLPTFERLYHDPIVGHSFESFVIEEILKGIEASDIQNCHSYYYRTRQGAEVDLILRGAFGVLPIEIKQGRQIRLKQLSALKTFIENHNCPFGIVINQALAIEWISPEILQIPIGYV